MARRKTAEELKLFGTYRRDRHANRGDAPAADGVPQRPRGLKGEARAHWDAVVPELARLGIVKQLDTSALTALCRMWSLYRATLGLLEQNPADKDARIAVSTYLKAWERLASKMGLTPADRSRLHIRPAEPPAGVSGFARKRG